MMGEADGSGAFREVLHSLTQFALAPLITQRCVYSIAVRTKTEDLQDFHSAFDYADRDRDGVVSRRDLGLALSWSQALGQVDPNRLFASADVDNRGSLDFRKFAAACLYTQLGPLDQWLAEHTFTALDVDEDGRLSEADVMSTIGFLPVGLPKHRRFSREEWVVCILGSMPPDDAWTLEVDDREKQDCSMDFSQGGLFAGCYTRKVSKQRQGSKLHFADDVGRVDMMATNVFLPKTSTACGQEMVAKLNFAMHAPGNGLSSPAYTPTAAMLR
eukprot:TRINITY_DN56813_c0_g1_i1.p1 TRINITY_DN56813_c0_g1~~TRINITY_DN56813_c0_g1_i1.p1  ORF type:complete len:272 (-),score=46.03 TRINITY_DN56813_c0_g1_i1:338-1153(-)